LFYISFSVHLQHLVWLCPLHHKFMIWSSRRKYSLPNTFILLSWELSANSIDNCSSEAAIIFISLSFFLYLKRQHCNDLTPPTSHKCNEFGTLEDIHTA
jgi:hypothetical protein